MIEKPGDLRRAQDHRQALGQAQRRHPDLGIAPAKRHAEEKAQTAMFRLAAEAACIRM